MKQIIEKYNKCEFLTDDELKIVIKHFEKLIEMLGEHGDLYHLVWRDAHDKLRSFEGMQNARREYGQKWVK